MCVFPCVLESEQGIFERVCQGWTGRILQLHIATAFESILVDCRPEGYSCVVTYRGIRITRKCLLLASRAACGCLRSRRVGRAAVMESNDGERFLCFLLDRHQGHAFYPNSITIQQLAARSLR